MSKVKISAKVDTSNVLHVDALNVFLKAIGDVAVKRSIEHAPVMKPVKEEAQETKEGGPATNVETLSPETIANWTAKEMRDMETGELKDACDILDIDYAAADGVNTNKKLRDLILDYFKADAPAETKEAAPIQETKKEAPAATEGGATIDDVRAAVTNNVGAHREAIKKELTRLGANNVTSLDASKFQDFLDFIDLL